MKNCKNLIFDIDGTLWDCTPVVANVFNAVLEKDGRVPYALPITADTLRREFGQPLDVIASHLFPTLSESEQHDLIDVICREQVPYLLEHRPSPFPGMYETIKALSEDHNLYIVSNCEAGYIDTLLTCTDMTPFFIDGLCPPDTGLLKAANIREIMRRHNMEEAVYIGDTMGDYQSCLEAGVPFILASYGFGCVPEAQNIIEKPEDLLTLFPSFDK